MSTDIDLDFAERKHAFVDLHCVPAVLRGERRPHPNGVYFHDIPVDPIDNMAVWDYKDAARRGYFKFDFLTNSVYRGVRSEVHLVDLLTREPPWEKFEDDAIVGQLAHVADHFDVVQQIKPHSILDLAVCIALPRPGKTHLIGKPRSEIDRNIWIKTDLYYYKKPHAIAFAASIVVQLNLLIEQTHD
jgi:hypothetical protein